MPEKYSIKDMRQLVSKYGGQCLSGEYIGSEASLIWQCKDDHRPFGATFNNLDRTVE